MRDESIFAIISQIQTKIDTQSANYVFIKESLDKISVIMKEELGILEEKIFSIDKRVASIESSREKKSTLISMLLMPFYSAFTKYASMLIFSSVIYCLFEGYKHIHDFNVLNFS